MAQNFTTEKKLINDFLQLYKDLECLWDPGHALYCNKESRDRAYEILLEKYKVLQDDATVDNVKKKIEYLRSGYRREHKKVLAARANGDGEYKPSLWYYEHLTFLNNVSEFGKFENVTFLSESDEESRTNLKYEDPHPKKAKLSSIFLTEEDHRADNDILISHDNNEQPEYLHVKHEAESFGRTVGLQISELTPLQRFIAEKIISDVIFYGRLERLRPQSALNLNDDTF